jgi:energy-coupling factor transporter ATP-binding protein EcfA2
MRILSFQIFNYKSIRETATIELEPGFNVVVGPNNVGKTALLEALSLSYSSNPHRSIDRPKGAPVSPSSSTRAKFILEKEEVRNFLLSNRDFWLGIRQGITIGNPIAQIIKPFIDINEIIFEHMFGDQNNGPVDAESIPYYANPNSNPQQHFAFQATVDGDSDAFTFMGNGQRGIHISQAAEACARTGVYMFRAERFNLGKRTFGDSKILRPDASNLPEVLNALQANPSRMEKLNGFLTAIFPSITRIVLEPVKNQEVEIRCWIAPPDTERDDLSFPLSSSGTGVGNVLAILYVVLTSETPKTIIIDEPNSYLHPGATRKLVEILSGYKQHQYILSTHSPEVISAASPRQILRLSWDGKQTVIEPIGPGQAQSMRGILSDLGVRLSDVFGADGVIWVDGSTEEQCFPLILSACPDRKQMGIVFRSIDQTGDLLGSDRRAKELVRIYRKLSEGIALIPAAVTFSLDREHMSDEKLSELKRQVSSKLHFLPRVNYEGYLLHPIALAMLMKDLDGGQTSVTPDQISQWFIDYGGQAKYHGRPSKQVPYGSPDWPYTVNGACILHDLFDNFFEGREVYRKTSHAQQLTKWLIDNDPAWLDELRDYILELLPAP